MGRNAQRRRNLRDARKISASLKRSRKRGPRVPRPYMDLLAYITLRWHPFDEASGRVDYTRYLTRRQVKRLLVQGKVNVNGEVYAYRHFPLHQLQKDEFGRPRIMVEGYPDTRPQGGVLL